MNTRRSERVDVRFLFSTWIVLLESIILLRRAEKERIVIVMDRQGRVGKGNTVGDAAFSAIDAAGESTAARGTGDGLEVF